MSGKQFAKAQFPAQYSLSHCLRNVSQDMLKDMSCEIFRKFLYLLRSCANLLARNILINVSRMTPRYIASDGRVSWTPLTLGKLNVSNFLGLVNSVSSVIVRFTSTQLSFAHLVISFNTKIQCRNLPEIRKATTSA